MFHVVLPHWADDTICGKSSAVFNFAFFGRKACCGCRALPAALRVFDVFYVFDLMSVDSFWVVGSWCRENEHAGRVLAALLPVGAES